MRDSNGWLRWILDKPHSLSVVRKTCTTGIVQVMGQNHMIKVDI
jgi:hypothetical protein